MKITAELNGVKLEKNIPTGWDQVTFEQFLKLATAQNDIQKISIFTGLDEQTLRIAKIKNLNAIISCLAFLSTTPAVDKIPETILGYKMPKNLELEEIGRYEDLKLELAKIKEGDVESVKVYATMCAIYAVDPYDYQKAEILSHYFLTAPCEEVMAVGNFTLMKLIGLNNPSLLAPLKRPSLMKRLRLGIRAWLSRLAFTARYYSWKRKLHLTEKSF